MTDAPASAALFFCLNPLALFVEQTLQANASAPAIFLAGYLLSLVRQTL